VSTTPWRVDAVFALERWERRDRPSPERITALLEWLFACGEQQPPGPHEGAVAFSLEDELTFVYRVPDVDVVVTYYVLVHERLMLVKEIEDVKRDTGG
jgi:hypothetical protein